jgi:hypothetical protein
MEDQFDIAKAVQEAGVDHAHDVGEIQGSIRAGRPAAISAKEFSGARVPQ